MFKDKRLLVLGAGRGQVGLLKTAKDMGINTIAGTLPNESLPGIKFADEVCHMDISNPQEVVSKAKDLNLDGVATSCLDTGVNALGRTCDELNLKGLSESAAILCQDKLKMKRVFMEHDISTAKFIKISSEKELNESFNQLQLPVIIKATDLQGSKGIYIAHTKEEALNGFKKSMSDTSREYCIIEEFIDGCEFGAQAFIYNEEILFVMPHGDDTFMSHTAIPVGHHVPLECSEDILRQANECVRAAIKALELNNCAVNVDLIVKDGKVYMIELTGRVGANGLPELVSINYGINYYEMIIATALGENPNEIWKNRAEDTNAGLVKMLFSENKYGTLKNIEYTGTYDEDMIDISFFKRIGDNIKVFENSNDCIGQVIVKGKDNQECEVKLKEIEKEIIIELL